MKRRPSRASFAGVAAAVVPPDELDEHALAVGEPWPRLTRLTGPAAPNKKTALTAEEVAIVEADAAACLACGATIVSMFASDIEPVYVAAARCPPCDRLAAHVAAAAHSPAHSPAQARRAADRRGVLASPPRRKPQVRAHVRAAAASARTATVPPLSLPRAIARSARAGQLAIASRRALAPQAVPQAFRGTGSGRCDWRQWGFGGWPP